jgi:glycosyltransferase involved in cell wall biosynthesis
MTYGPVKLAIVVPCYNEEAVLAETSARLSALLERLVVSNCVTPTSEIVFVDDGSSDATWGLIQGLTRAPGSRVCGLKLSRNRGHQNAVLAGLFGTESDVTISIDADLQDDIEAIPRMLAAYQDGCDIVYGVRSARHADTAFKRMTAQGYYRVLAWMGVEIVFDHADYRLMSRRAVDALRQYDESNLFLRGIVPQLGFRSAVVPYARSERFAGESKYPLVKMLALAWQGVTSFSAVPLRLITVLGLVVSMISLGLAGWALSIRLLTASALPGWASIVIPIFLISGVQLISLGVIGEYVAKIYLESKRRPRYIVDQVIRSDAGRPPATPG